MLNVCNTFFFSFFVITGNFCSGVVSDVEELHCANFYFSKTPESTTSFIHDF